MEKKIGDSLHSAVAKLGQIRAETIVMGCFDADCILHGTAATTSSPRYCQRRHRSHRHRRRRRRRREGDGGGGGDELDGSTVFSSSSASMAYTYGSSTAMSSSMVGASVSFDDSSMYGHHGHHGHHDHHGHHYHRYYNPTVSVASSNHSNMYVDATAYLTSVLLVQNRRYLKKKDIRDRKRES